MATIHNGVCIYNVDEHGNHVGFYANDIGVDAGKAFTEMGRKISTSSGDLYDGVYDCAWYESTSLITGQLKIALRPLIPVYDLEWTSAGKLKPDYLGVGYVLNNHLIVTYKSTF